MTWASEMNIKTMPSERERISSYDAAYVNVNHDGYVFNRNLGLGTAMTRALGNTAFAAAGTIPTPCTTYPCYLSNHDDPSSYHIVIMATDGVWKILSNEQVAELVLKERDNVCSAAEAVAKGAFNAYAEKTNDTINGMRSDDITCLVF